MRSFCCWKVLRCLEWETDHIGTKSKREVERHYLEIYIDIETFPVPDLNRSFSEEQLQKFEEQRKKLLLEPRVKFMDDVSLKPPGQSRPASHEITGFMPYRKEFETDLIMMPRF
jgi:transcriptional adapter 2-alpha